MCRSHHGQHSQRPLRPHPCGVRPSRHGACALHWRTGQGTVHVGPCSGCLGRAGRVLAGRGISCLVAARCMRPVPCVRKRLTSRTAHHGERAEERHSLPTLTKPLPRTACRASVWASGGRTGWTAASGARTSPTWRASRASPTWGRSRWCCPAGEQRGGGLDGAVHAWLGMG